MDSGAKGKGHVIWLVQIFPIPEQWVAPIMPSAYWTSLWGQWYDLVFIWSGLGLAKKWGHLANWIYSMTRIFHKFSSSLMAQAYFNMTMPGFIGPQYDRMVGHFPAETLGGFPAFMYFCLFCDFTPPYPESLPTSAHLFPIYTSCVVSLIHCLSGTIQCTTDKHLDHPPHFQYTHMHCKNFDNLDLFTN